MRQINPRHFLRSTEPEIIFTRNFLVAENWLSGALFTVEKKLTGTSKRHSLLPQPKQNFKFQNKLSRVSPLKVSKMSSKRKPEIVLQF